MKDSNFLRTMNNDYFTNEAFTVTVSKYLNKFINDLADKKEEVLKSLETFPGKYHLLLKKAIEEGPSTLPVDDVDVFKNFFNFLEYYSTGKTSDNLEIEFVGDKGAKD